MLSATSAKPLCLFLEPYHHYPSSFLLNLHPRPFNRRHLPPKLLKPVSATIPPSGFPSPSPPPDQLYQPFRPPTQPIQSPQTPLSPDAILDTLRNRLGLWHEYAPLIPVLSRQYSFTPSSIEESTGISGVEQNRLVVATQVRGSILSLDPPILAFFDSTGGAELLYELRPLSAQQRLAAARRVADLNLGPKAAQDIARAMKDFPRRRAEDGWNSFSPASPGDCVAFAYLRVSRERTNPVDRDADLDRALATAETDSARLWIEQEIKRFSESGDETNTGLERRITVPVVRMKMGEVGESKSVAVLPVVREADGEEAVAEAPSCLVEGEFRVVVAEKGWKRWVVLPGWEPLVGLGNGGVAVRFVDGRVLPWKVNKGYMEEVILVIADRERKEVVEDEGFYLVVNEEKKIGNLNVVKGEHLKERGVTHSLGMVVLVVRPPTEEVEDQLQEEDWE